MPKILYERYPIKHKDFDLWELTFTDDTVLSVKVADGILNKGKLQSALSISPNFIRMPATAAPSDCWGLTKIIHCFLGSDQGN